MINDNILEQLKNKNIEEITLVEKFELIQFRMKGISCDYKSPWWLDNIFDEYLSNNPNIDSISMEQKRGEVTFYIVTKRQKQYIYTSIMEKRNRHDAMLNVLTLYFIDNQ